MKQTILITFALIANLGLAQYDYQNVRVLNADYEFEEGSTEILYGDNVVLRKKPSGSAKALDTLSIGSEITILENTNKQITVNGKKSVWYKVETSSSTGYIAGGFIALDSRKVNGGTYMVIMAKAEETEKFRVRYLKNGEYYGKEGDLQTYSFVLRAHDDRGVEGIESMVLIDFMAESCGVDGGFTYLFNDGQRLIKAMHCAEIGDGGYWFSEKLTFPDEREWGTHIDYEREVGRPMNDEYSWYQSQKDVVTIQWKGDHFEPNVEDIDFGGDDW
ncbi:MAG: SH3 domain-containing protein [Fluviicola sp.]